MSTTEENIKKLFVLKKLYNQTFNTDEKTLAGYVVFAKALYQRDFTSQQELSDCCGCNKAHTSRTLLKMQKCGYVALKKEEDEKKISLTPAGRQFAQKAIKQEKACIIRSHRCQRLGLSSRISILQKVSKSWAKMSHGVMNDTIPFTNSLTGAKKGSLANIK